VRGLTESREDVVGRAVDEEDYERKKREIEKLTRALDVRIGFEQADRETKSDGERTRGREEKRARIRG